jgi:prevent-host-death family protein
MLSWTKLAEIRRFAMVQVGAFEAKNTFGSLLDRVEAGEHIQITRHGRPVAQLIPAPTFSSEQRQLAREAMARIRQRAVEAKNGPFDWEEWKAYRDEGRR